MEYKGKPCFFNKVFEEGEQLASNIANSRLTSSVLRALFFNTVVTSSQQINLYWIVENQNIFN